MQGPVTDTWLLALQHAAEGWLGGPVPDTWSLILQEAAEGQHPGSGHADEAGDLEQTADLLAAASASTSGHQLPTDPKGEVALEVSVPPGAGDKTGHASCNGIRLRNCKWLLFPPDLCSNGQQEGAASWQALRLFQAVMPRGTTCHIPTAELLLTCLLREVAGNALPCSCCSGAGSCRQPRAGGRRDCPHG